MWRKLPNEICRRNNTRIVVRTEKPHARILYSRLHFVVDEAEKETNRKNEKKIIETQRGKESKIEGMSKREGMRGDTMCLLTLSSNKLLCKTAKSANGLRQEQIKGFAGHKIIFYWAAVRFC